MANEMIERVARALWETQDPRYVASPRMAWDDLRVSAAHDAVAKDSYDKFCLRAKYMIFTLRVPASAMIEEGAGVIPCGQGEEEGPANTAGALECWQAMIDVALSDQ